MPVLNWGTQKKITHLTAYDINEEASEDPPLIYRIWSPSQVGLKALILTILDIQRALTTNTLISILQLGCWGEPLKG